jgi:hypothetical protein
MRRGALIAALTAVAVACLGAPATGQNGGGFYTVLVGFGPSFRHQWDMGVRFEGSVVVRFSGPSEAGTVVWTPGEGGQLTAAEGHTRDGKRAFTAFLGPIGGQAAVAHVLRDGRLCTDEGSPFLDGASVRQGRDGVRVALVASGPAGGGLSLTETRCGGPLSGDLAQVLRPVRLTAAQLRTGRFDIDLRASGAFAHGDLRGTVESTVVAHVGRRRPPERDNHRAPPGKPYRELNVTYSVERVDGTVAAAFAGGELCDELGSCGDAGTWLLRPGQTHGTVTTRVFAPLARPPRDLLTAAGLETGGDTHRLQFYGSGNWSSRSAALTASVTRAGRQICADTRRTGGGAVQLEGSGQSVRVTLLALDDPLRTSCPGPALADGFAGSPLATGTIPLRSLGKRRVVVPLRRGSSVTTDGWAGTTRPSLTLVLRRNHLRFSRFSF